MVDHREQLYRSAIVLGMSASGGRIALVMHTTSYGLDGFVSACRRVGAEPLIASDRCPVLDRAWDWPADAVAIDFGDPDAAAEEIAAAARRQRAPVRAVLPVGGELPALVAARAAQRLSLPANDPAAMAAAGNKLRMRELCAAARDPDLRAPRFFAVEMDADPGAVAARVAAPGGVGFPCVVKPLLLSASRGVMRADDAASFAAAFARLRAMLSAPALLDLDATAARLILVESFVPGAEVALEGILSEGTLEMLALFDKPDPLDGPFFEESIYVTPSRLPSGEQMAVARAVAGAARALGLRTGPVHAELRLGPAGPVVIEVAARSIGGLCARALRFDGGLTLEELVVRHALGEEVASRARERRASGVMMIPIPAREPGVLRAVDGVGEARAVPGVEDVVISIRAGETVVPLPEGASYLGFIFARGETGEGVERALRDAHKALAFDVDPEMRVLQSVHG
jgi:biotin carboxylase